MRGVNVTPSCAGTSTFGASSRPRAVACEFHLFQERLDARRLQRQSFQPVPFVAGPDVLRGAECFHLRHGHQAGMIVLVALERQTDALDGVGDETNRPIMIDRLERSQHARHVVAAEIRHQRQQFIIAAFFDQFRHSPLIADVVEEMFAECGPTLKAQGCVHLVRAAIDPFAQRLAARLGERRLHQLAVFHDHHIPAEIAEHGLELFPKSFADHRIKTLAVVVDHPPGIAQTLLPAFQQRLEDVAFVEFGVANQRDHAAFRPILHPAVRLDVILHQRREQRLRHAEADRAGGEIHVVDVLGARGIGLRTLEAAEILQLVAGLLAEQILDRVKHRTGVWLHRHAIFRLQHTEIQRRHNCRQRRA